MGMTKSFLRRRPEYPAARSLDLLHALIGQPLQVLERRPPGGYEHGKPDRSTHRDDERLAAHPNRPQKSCVDSPGQPLGSRVVGEVAKQDQKLVASPILAAHHIRDAHRRGHAEGKGAQDLVTYVGAVKLVELPEPIEVQEQESMAATTVP